jgi:Ca2+-binding EF-hand superfamily protein
VLAEFPEFDPNTSFSRLDRKRHNYLDVDDIVDFFYHNQEDISEEEAYLFVKAYDEDKDGVLSMDEFLNAILPTYRPSLKKIATPKKIKVMSA